MVPPWSPQDARKRGAAGFGSRDCSCMPNATPAGGGRLEVTLGGCAMLAGAQACDAATESGSSSHSGCRCVDRLAWLCVRSGRKGDRAGFQITRLFGGHTGRRQGHQLSARGRWRPLRFVEECTLDSLCGQDTALLTRWRVVCPFAPAERCFDARSRSLRRRWHLAACPCTWLLWAPNALRDCCLAAEGPNRPSAFALPLRSAGSGTLTLRHARRG